MAGLTWRVEQLQFVPKVARKATPEQIVAAEKEDAEKTLTAASGYVVQEPRAQISILSGYFHALSSVVDAEGMTSLWKGNITATSVDVTRSILQPTLESLLNESYGLDDETPLQYVDRFWPNVGTMVASHVVSTVVLAPSELILTRISVQPRAESARKYSGYFHCLRTIVAEEGVEGLFRAIVPEMALQVFRPLYRSLVPILLERAVGLTEGSIAFNLARMLFHTTELLVTMPLETVTTRLQAQYRLRYLQSDRRRYQPMVAPSPLPYAGPVDCVRRMIDEEGVGSLYRGLGIHLLLNLAEFVTSVFTVVEVDEDFEEDLSVA